MKLTEQQILSSALKNLEALFKDMPNFGGLEALHEAPPRIPGGRLDAEIEVQLGNRRLLLLLAATAYSQPAKLRETAENLRTSLKKNASAQGVLCADYVSPAAAKVCADEHLGYVDLCGNCRLVFDNIYIEREGKPNQYPERRNTKALTGLFSLKASRVLKVLLRRLDLPWKLQDAATLAEVSLPEAFKVARMLEERELAGGRRGKFTLKNPENLLKLWSANYKPREHGRLQCYTMQSIKEIEERYAAYPDAEKHLRGQLMHEQTRAIVVSPNSLALGKFSAAEYLAPHVNYSVATIYMQEDPTLFVQRMGLKPVEKGGNVELIEPVDPWFLNDRCGAFGRWVTSPAQTYLDLMQEPVRGPEAAEVLLKEFRTLTPKLWMGEGVSYG